MAPYRLEFTSTDLHRVRVRMPGDAAALPVPEQYPGAVSVETSGDYCTRRWCTVAAHRTVRREVILQRRRDDAARAHPNCRCTAVFQTIPESRVSVTAEYSDIRSAHTVRGPGYKD